jgi:hypothetical protein
MPARKVLTAITAIWGSFPLSVEPGLKPNQPTKRIIVPRTTYPML